MNSIKHQQSYTINSSNVLSGTTSDFRIILNKNGLDVYDRVVVLNITIPKTYYLIQNDYDTFVLEEKGVQVNIKLSQGFYTVNTLKVEVLSQLNALSPNNWVYSCVYIPRRGFYTFNVTGNAGDQPKFIFTDNIYDNLGFKKNSTNTFVGDTITSVNCIRLQKESSIYLCSDIVYNDVDNEILENVGSSGSDMSYLHFSTNGDAQFHSKQMKKSPSNIYRFYLLSSNLKPISLNGNPFSFELLIYKKDDINDNIRTGIKYLANYFENEHKK